MICKPPFSVLVNSCDAFDDCWLPFFTLFGRYWPECDAPVLLNTETKDWSCEQLPVVATRVQAGLDRRLTWSECLLAALEHVRTPLVLYMQEDYFLQRLVRDSAVREAAALMLRDPEVKHIALSRHCSAGPYLPHPGNGFRVIRPRARYRISTQAGLWRVETLRSYLRPRENGWMFEILGTVRAWRRQETFLTVDYSGPEGPPMEYIHTGIIKGAWHQAMPEIFAANGLAMDFSRRGFYVEKPGPLRKLETLRRLASDPVGVLRGLLT
jgi:hypothetical protein